MLEVTRVTLSEGDKLIKKWDLGPGRKCSGHLGVFDQRQAVLATRESDVPLHWDFSMEYFGVGISVKW